jgi:hypothetical protein
MVWLPGPLKSSDVVSNGLRMMQRLAKTLRPTERMAMPHPKIDFAELGAHKSNKQLRKAAFR